MRIWFQVDGEDYLLEQGTDYTVDVGNHAITFTDKAKEQVRAWNEQHIKVHIKVEVFIS